MCVKFHQMRKIGASENTICLNSFEREANSLSREYLNLPTLNFGHDFGDP